MLGLPNKKVTVIPVIYTKRITCIFIVNIRIIGQNPIHGKDLTSLHIRKLLFFG